MTEENRMARCCPNCKSTNIHHNKHLHDYFCSKCKQRSLLYQLIARDVRAPRNLPKHLIKAFQRAAKVSQ
ncbi:MAG: hypothetical protein ACP5N0_13610 [Methanosarcina sp.]|uniref:hypothetical protein n=1 Tax=Methanosarcina sp. TaxID=2213 RepID=UPI003BB63A12